MQCVQRYSIYFGHKHYQELLNFIDEVPIVKMGLTTYLLLLIVALLNGANSEGPPQCRFPGAPAHSSVSFSDERLVSGSVATYSCERGFELLGPTRRVCGEDGQWTPEGIPFCGEYYIIENHNLFGDGGNFN
ncbi:hypothetical protein B566_EDAN003880 [Ephemera danica]|nr:hypothetical protein B566_EDAN003880 [Ephemera danica]